MRNPAAAPRSPDRFRLSGPTVALDTRVNAVRSDVADVALAGRLFAPHYAEPMLRSAVPPVMPMLSAGKAGAPAISELRRGDGFAVVDESGGWAWGYSCDDHYVGYVPAAALGPVVEATHRVRVRTALVFAAPDIKSPLVERLPFGATLAARDDGAFLAIDGGFVHPRHLQPLATREDDPAAVAETLTGTPYLWGGRSGAGTDCSGLVQLALACCGLTAPRDSDQQRAALGRALPADAPLARNDLVFFPGHVGIMADADRLIHANAYWMQVVVEPLAAIVARGAEIVARRRIMP